MNSTQEFDSIAIDYDVQFSETEVGRTQRELVWSFLRKALFKSKYALELNCGTGIDARWLAENGYTVLATDIAEKMINISEKKCANFCEIEFRISAIQEIKNVSCGRKYDLVLSNFGGLNCLSPRDFEFFLNQNLVELLNPKGRAVFVIMPKFCLIESIYFLYKMQLSSIFRRNTNHSVRANLNSNTSIGIWYYSPSYIRKKIPKNLKISHLQPVGFFIPPSYLNSLVDKRPRLLFFLKKLESWALKFSFLANYSDHYLIEISQEL